MLEQVWNCEESLSHGILQPTFKDFQKATSNVHFTVNWNKEVNANVKIRYDLVGDFLFDAVSKAVVNIVFAWLSVQIKFLMLG